MIKIGCKVRMTKERHKDCFRDTIGTSADPFFRYTVVECEKPGTEEGLIALEETKGQMHLKSHLIYCNKKPLI